MTQIVRGILEFNETTRNARGGTELIAQRMVDTIPKEILEPYQIVHSRVRELDPNLKKILVLHDLPGDPESAKLADLEFRKQFEKIVAVSNWQMQQYIQYYDMKYSDFVVIKNGIFPIDVGQKPDAKEQLNIVYHTTPHRGLAILVPVFEYLSKYHPNIHLHVFSSFDIYGWPERNKPFEQLFYTCKNHPKITYYGSVSNDTIREKLADMHIFAYPSIWPETSCLAAIEAMSAKCMVVAPNYAGLIDTCQNWSVSYQYHEDPQKHAEIFAAVLNGAINDYMKNQPSGATENQLGFQKAFFDIHHGWDRIKQEWINLLSN